MSIAVDVARIGVTVPISADRVREIVQAVCRKERVRDAMISVTFVTNPAIAKLHKTYLGQAGVTDIVTFELKDGSGVIVGDVYIAPNVARTNARTHGVGIREELTRLLVHGTLHVLGHTHPAGEHRTTSPMWRRQEQLVTALTK